MSSVAGTNHTPSANSACYPPCSVVFRVDHRVDHRRLTRPTPFWHLTAGAPHNGVRLHQLRYPGFSNHPFIQTYIFFLLLRFAGCEVIGEKFDRPSHHRYAVSNCDENEQSYTSCSFGDLKQGGRRFTM